MRSRLCGNLPVLGVFARHSEGPERAGSFSSQPNCAAVCTETGSETADNSQPIHTKTPISMDPDESLKILIRFAKVNDDYGLAT